MTNNNKFMLNLFNNDEGNNFNNYDNQLYIVHRKRWFQDYFILQVTGVITLLDNYYDLTRRDYQRVRRIGMCHLPRNNYYIDTGLLKTSQLILIIRWKNQFCCQHLRSNTYFTLWRNCSTLLFSINNKAMRFTLH